MRVRLGGGGGGTGQERPRPGVMSLVTAVPTHHALTLEPLEPLEPAVAQCSMLGSGLLPRLDVGPFIVIYRRLFILLTANCLYRQFS